MAFRKIVKYAVRAAGTAAILTSVYYGNRALRFYSNSDQYVKPTLVSVYHAYPELYRKDAAAESLAAMGCLTAGILLLKE